MGGKVLSAERWGAHWCVAVQIHRVARDTGGIAGQCCKGKQ